MSCARALAVVSSFVLATGCVSPTYSEGPSSDKRTREKAPAAASASEAIGGGSAAEDPARTTAPAGAAWASDAEHDALAPIVRPFVEAHLGTPAAWNGDASAVGVGILKGGKQYFFGFGSDRSGKPVTRTTIFEIGSITKTFTGLVLADALMKGKIGLDDRANDHLPPRLRVPSRNGKEITIRHLATHRSGLPQMATGTVQSALGMLDPKEQALSRAQLETWLGTATLEDDPGEAFAYSNVGAALVGFAVEARVGRSYAELVAEVVTRPLAMTRTQVMDGSPTADKVAGHNMLGREILDDGLTKDSGYAPAGAIRSNVEDMLRYAAAQARASATSVAPAVAFAQRRYADGLDTFTAMLMGTKFTTGLLIFREGGGGETPAVVHHNGMTSGFTSDMRASTTDGVATVVLTNRGYMDLLEQKPTSELIDEPLFDAVRRP